MYVLSFGRHCCKVALLTDACCQIYINLKKYSPLPHLPQVLIYVKWAHGLEHKLLVLPCMLRPLSLPLLLLLLLLLRPSAANRGQVLFRHDVVLHFVGDSMRAQR
jgi:hypothetical protein